MMVENVPSAEAACEEAAAIDPDGLLKRCMGNASFVMALLDELEATGKRRVEEVTSAFDDGNLPATADAAHSLKGAAGIMGAERLKDLAGEIERIGESGEAEDLTSLVGQLKREMDRCLEVIPKVREQVSFAN